MYKHIFLNPFYWYAVIWSVVLVLYPLGWTQAYAPLSFVTQLFFFMTIAASLVAGFFLAKYLKRVHFAYRRPRWMWICALVMLLAFAADFLYARHIPLIDELLGSDRTYKDFNSMPVVHVAVFTFAMFFGAYAIYCGLREKDRRRKIEYLCYYALVLLMYLFLYNRAALLMTLFIGAVIMLSLCRKIRPWHIAVCAVAVLICLYLFGVLGNIRSGSRWYDTSYLMTVAEIDPGRVPPFLPKPFLWVYVYLISPLGNINNLISNHITATGFRGVLSCIIPDTVSFRLFPDLTGVEPPRVLENLTVASGFARIYYFGGFIGMVTLFAYMVLLVCVLIRLSLEKTDFICPMWAICSCMIAFLFFDNFLNYIGMLFAFFYPVAIIAYEWWRDRRTKKEKKYRFLPLEPRMKLSCPYTGPHD